MVMSSDFQWAWAISLVLLTAVSVDSLDQLYSVSSVSLADTP